MNEGTNGIQKSKQNQNNKATMQQSNNKTAKPQKI